MAISLTAASTRSGIRSSSTPNRRAASASLSSHFAQAFLGEWGEGIVLDQSGRQLAFGLPVGEEFRIGLRFYPLQMNGWKVTKSSSTSDGSDAVS